jgi:hypothetical protein
MHDPTTLERAFALARSGTCAGVNDIRLALKRERFDQVEAHLAGQAIARQLRALCEAAQAPEPDSGEPVPGP